MHELDSSTADSDDPAAARAPAGFQLIQSRGGFSGVFGPVFFDPVGHRIGFRIQPRHLNPFGSAHGGAISTFADKQIVAVVEEKDGWPVVHCPTVSLSVDYLGSTKLDAWVEATVQLLKRTRTLIFTQALISADGTLVARAHGVYRNFAG